jgi:ketosteroid isomerase-like protein
MFSLTEEYFDEWMTKYGQAWIDGDADAVLELYADDGIYYETPYDEPFGGAKAIHKYWSEGAGISQKDVTFSHEVWMVKQNTGLVKWEASFVRIPSGNYVELDGVMQVIFDEQGKCSEFREWWHRREVNPDGEEVKG